MRFVRLAMSITLFFGLFGSAPADDPSPKPLLQLGPGRIAAPRPGRPAPAGQQFTQWNKAEFVFTATLDGVEAGPVGRSFPPVYVHHLSFTIRRVLRGALKPDQKVRVSNIARQVDEPTFPVGKLCLVAAKKAQNSMRILAVVEADDAKVEAVAAQVSLPLGWKLVDGKPTSPWASLGKQAWNVEADLPGDVRCAATGRPALFVGPGLEFNVEPVPPAREIQWTNPDGDGEYKLTLKNTSDQPVVVPALLVRGDKVLWDECVVILCQGVAYPAPGAEGVSGKVQPLELAPGASASTVIHALRLDGPAWPQGGYRIEFQFCLGEKSRTMSFYYMSRHHDGIRRQARGQ